MNANGWCSGMPANTKRAKYDEVEMVFYPTVLSATELTPMRGALKG
ncbi:hypothetical protein ACTXPA_07270 [Glutamicibacter arilaitensis]